MKSALWYWAQNALFIDSNTDPSIAEHVVFVSTKLNSSCTCFLVHNA